MTDQNSSTIRAVTKTAALEIRPMPNETTEPTISKKRAYGPLPTTNRTGYESGWGPEIGALLTLALIAVAWGAWIILR